MADVSSSIPPSSVPPVPSVAVVAPSPARNLVTELVGTFVLMLAGPGLIVLGGGRIDELAVALSFGAAVALSLGVIGAVANPAFTLSLLLVREISAKDAAVDWLGQLLGGVVGAAVIWSIDDRTRGSLGTNGWDRNGFGELGSVMAAELVFTLVMVVILLSCISQGLSKPAIAAFTGMAAAIGYLVLLGIDGGGMNPARSIGSALFADTDPNALGQVWVFVVVPLVAAVAAVFVWLMIDDAEIDDTVFDDTILDDAQDRLTGDPT